MGCPSSACASAACMPRTGRCPPAISPSGAASATSCVCSSTPWRRPSPSATTSSSARRGTGGATVTSSIRARCSAGSPSTRPRATADPSAPLPRGDPSHAHPDPLCLHRLHGCRSRQGGPLQRGLRHRARASHPEGARGDRGREAQEDHPDPAPRRREEDHRGGERAHLHRDVRDRESGRSHERGVGRGGGARPLACPGPAVHEEPPPRSVRAPAPLGRARMVPIGLGAVAAVQLLAAAALYPALALAVIGTADLLGTIARNAGGVWLALVTGGVLLVAAILLLLGIFLVAPLVLCVGGVALVGRLARRRGVEITGSQALKFGVALVAVNVALALVGAWLWPWWWYTEKMATRAPLWLLVLLFGASAVIDAAAGAAMARARVGRRSGSR